MTEPVDDTIQDRIEEKMRDLMLLSNDLLDLKVLLRGEPWEMPIQVYPWGTVFLLETSEDLEQAETGYIRYVHSGFVSIEVAVSDTRGLAPDRNRKAYVPSHQEVKKYGAAAWQALEAWDPGADPVYAEDFATSGHRTIEKLHLDRMTHSLQARTEQHENRATIEWHLLTRKNDFD